MKKPLKKDIENSLVEQLEANGLVEAHYLDLVKDYMYLWSIKGKLQTDIRKRGVVIEWKNGPNQYGSKKNDSVAELTKVNGQMLKILSDLGLKGADQGVDEDDGDEEM